MSTAQAGAAKSAPRRKDDRALVQMRFKRELHAQVRAAAAREDLPVSQWIRLLCIRAIERAEKPAGELSS
ncbi:MAG: hypothetical protein WAL95_04940 [Candidatus Acidiferrales bacterium]